MGITLTQLKLVHNAIKNLGQVTAKVNSVVEDAPPKIKENI